VEGNDARPYVRRIDGLKHAIFVFAYEECTILFAVRFAASFELGKTRDIAIEIFD
jgi:hypothetical protein